MERGVWRRFFVLLLLISSAVLAPGACARARPPVVEAPPPRAALGLGRPPDPRFMYAVRPDGVYAVAKATDREGRPIFSRKRIKVASIEPALDPTIRMTVDRDGDLVPMPPARPLAPAPKRKLVVLVPDPGTHLDVGPRSRTEFLALDDETLVAYTSAWLRYRGLQMGDTSLSQAERDVMLASDAFLLISGDGFSGLLAIRAEQLSQVRDGLRRMSLDQRADVIEAAQRLAAAGAQAESRKLDEAWSALAEDPVPHVAAYIRAHADEFDWDHMAR